MASSLGPCYYQTRSASLSFPCTFLGPGFEVSRAMKALCRQLLSFLPPGPNHYPSPSGIPLSLLPRQQWELEPEDWSVPDRSRPSLPIPRHRQAARRESSVRICRAGGQFASDLALHRLDIAYESWDLGARAISATDRYIHSLTTHLSTQLLTHT